MTSELSVKLRGIEIDNQLKFNSHATTLCQKAGSQLNTIGRLRKYLGKCFDRSFCIFKLQTMSFSLPIYLHDSTNKIESIQKRALRLLYNDYTSTYDSRLANVNKS